MGSDQSLLANPQTVNKYVCDNYECTIAKEGDMGKTTFSSIKECKTICSGGTDTKWYIGLIFVLILISVMLLSVKGKFKKG